MAASRVFIVEDYKRLRETLEEYLRKVEWIELCGSSESAEEALDKLDAAQPDLLLIDVSLPGMSGLDMLAELKKRGSDRPCVMLSGHRSNAYVKLAREAGARAYVVKAEMLELKVILRHVLEGGTRFRDYD